MNAGFEYVLFGDHKEEMNSEFFYLSLASLARNLASKTDSELVAREQKRIARFWINKSKCLRDKRLLKSV